MRVLLFNVHHLDTQNTNVNKAARKLRHKKVFGAFIKKGRLKKVKNDTPIKETSSAENIDKKDLSRFLAKCSATLLALFLMTSVFPTYAYNYEYIEEDTFELSDSFAMEKVATTNDGFIINTSGQSEEGDRSQMSDTIIYVVEDGDTLSTIAGKFNLNIKTIAWANDITNANQIRVGKKLVILPVNGVLHKVAKKDTLNSIAKKYKAKKNDIVAQNQIEDAQIVIGDSLIVPGGTIPQPKPIPRDYVAFNRSNTGRTAPADVSSYNAPTVDSNNFSTGVIRLIKPASGRTTQGYRRGHYAVDIANRNKGPIYAAASGKIVKASYGWNGGYGNVIIVDHGNGVKTLYAHNEALYVKVGDFVSQGQTIAWMGNTGRVYGATGIHLHFELIVNGVKKNPAAYY